MDMSPTKMSKIESAVRTILEYNSAYNRHDITKLMQLVGEDCVIETSGPGPDGTRLTGKMAIEDYLEAFFLKYPGAHSEIEDIYGLGKRCIMRWKLSVEMGENGDYVRGVDICRVQDGLIREMLSYQKASAAPW
jgi:ketosteroid isomerase-like protein